MYIKKLVEVNRFLIRNTFIKKAVPYLLLLAGLYLIPLQLFKTDLSRMPGDLGDTRFNNYILEHGYRFLIGKENSFWSAPFMYPVEKTVAFSDNHIGTVLFYSAFRMAGMDRETSLQFWIITINILNFLICFLIFKKWTGSSVIAAATAYIFTFSLLLVQFFNHIQVYPIFMLPVIFYYAFRFFQQLNPKHLYISGLAIIFQLYSGMYIAIFAIFALLIFFISFLLVYGSKHFFIQFFKLRNLFSLIILFATGILVCYPLLSHYLANASMVQERTIDDYKDFLPAIRSYFFTGWWSLFWNRLASHGLNTLSSYWNHYHFTGIVPWMAVVVGIVLLFIKKIKRVNKNRIAFSLISLLLIIFPFLKIGEWSIFEYVLLIPGFKFTRSIDRIIIVQLFFFCLVFSAVLTVLIREFPKSILVMILLIPFIVIENMIIPDAIKSFDKAESQNRIIVLEDKIKNMDNPVYKALAITSTEFNADNYFIYHLDAMIATQNLGRKTVNAYTGYFPDEYHPFLMEPNRTNLEYWCTVSGVNINDIGIMERITGTAQVPDTVYIKGNNNLYLTFSHDETALIHCRSDLLSENARFAIMKYDNNKYVIKGSNGKYVSAELSQSQELTVNRRIAREWEYFFLDTLPSGKISIKASNSKYLIVEPETFIVKAISDTVVPFEIIHID
jgi:hypothetical protein